MIEIKAFLYRQVLLTCTRSSLNGLIFAASNISNCLQSFPQSMLFINNHQYFTISDMTEGTNASGMLEQLTSGLTISEDIDKAQAFQNAQDHRQAIQYYEKVCIIDYHF